MNLRIGEGKIKSQEETMKRLEENRDEQIVKLKSNIQKSDEQESIYMGSIDVFSRMLEKQNNLKEDEDDVDRWSGRRRNHHNSCGHAPATEEAAVARCRWRRCARCSCGGGCRGRRCRGRSHATAVRIVLREPIWRKSVLRPAGLPTVRLSAAVSEGRPRRQAFIP